MERGDTCGCQAEEDANSDRDWHFEEHPKKASLKTAFVDLAKHPARG
jgi:hypothetical protein